MVFPIATSLGRKRPRRALRQVMPRRNNTVAAPRCNRFLFTMLARLHGGGGSPRRIAATSSAPCLASSTGNQDPKPAINAFLTWKEGEYELVQVGAGGFFPTRQFFRPSWDRRRSRTSQHEGQPEAAPCLPDALRCSLRPTHKKAPRECWARLRGRLARSGCGRIKRAMILSGRRSGAPRQPSESTHAMVRQKKAPRRRDGHGAAR
jgi:hypothetical protein